jgi:hypothetical protein
VDELVESSTQYVIGNVVYSGGSAYIAIAANQNSTPGLDAGYGLEPLGVGRCDRRDRRHG